MDPLQLGLSYINLGAAALQVMATPPPLISLSVSDEEVIVAFLELAMEYFHFMPPLPPLVPKFFYLMEFMGPKTYVYGGRDILTKLLNNPMRLWTLTSKYIPWLNIV